MEHPTGEWQGGVGTYVSTMTSALALRGHEVHVLSCGQMRRRRDITVDGVQIHHRPWMHIPGLDRVMSPPAADRIRAALTCWVESRRLGLRPDIVETPEWMAEGLVFTFFGGAPVVAHLHTPYSILVEKAGRSVQPADRAADRLERLTVRRAASVTAAGRLLVDDLHVRGWLTQDQPVHVIRLPVDVERWGLVPTPAHAPQRILVVGRQEARKCPELVLEALASLGNAAAGVEVLFAGRPSGTRDGLPYDEWLKGIDSGSSTVMFVGELDGDQLVELMASVRVVAVPSRYESFSLALVEGMAAGRPVVSTDGVGAAELLINGGGGRVVSVGDAIGMAAALAAYIADPALAAAVGGRARQVAWKECAAAVIARQREEFYGRVMGQWTGRRRRGHARWLPRRPRSRGEWP
jgi:glycogen(starch) synthase